MSTFHTTLEKIEAAIGGIGGSGGGFYLKELRARIDSFNIGDPSYHWAMSEDGGLTCPAFSDGTKSILSHDLVVQEQKTFCQRLVSGESATDPRFEINFNSIGFPVSKLHLYSLGEIYRPNNDFGSARFNDLLWEGETPPVLLWNLPVEQGCLISFSI